MKKLLAMLMVLCLLTSSMAMAEPMAIPMEGNGESGAAYLDIDDEKASETDEATASKPTKVTLADSKTVTAYIGTPLELGYAVEPENADVSLLKWSTSSKKIAAVENGVVTPVKEGTATITVKAPNGKKDTVKVKVVDPYKPTGVVLAESGTVTLNMGETLQLNAALQPETAKSALKWSTSSKKIAVADENGVVTPLKEGTATITVKTSNGKKDSVKVKVVDPYKPTGVVLAESGTVTLNMGETLQLNAALQPETAKSVLKWSTSSKKIAVADENGVVTPLKEGTVTITVKTSNGKKDTVKVKVVDPYKPSKVVLNVSGTVQMEVGKMMQLGATLEPATAKSALKWKSSSAKIAKVDENGVVTAVKAGTATITVTTANGKKDTVKIKVVKAESPADGKPATIELLDYLHSPLSALERVVGEMTWKGGVTFVDKEGELQVFTKDVNSVPVCKTLQAVGARYRLMGLKVGMSKAEALALAEAYGWLDMTDAFASELNGRDMYIGMFITKNQTLANALLQFVNNRLVLIGVIGS